MGAALEPSRFYALAGDLVGVDSGRLLRYTGTSDVRFGQLRYEGHGAVRMIAGRDIVSSGTGLGSERTASDNMGVYASSGNLFVNTSATDVSLVQAGRDILYGNFNVAGPGSLEISAGRNLLMNDEVAVTSLGRSPRATRAPAPASSCRRAPARRTTPASSGVTWSSTTWRRQERPWRNSPARWYGSTKTN